MRGPLSGAAETYNYVEIGIWCATATVVAVVALRRDFFIASLVLFAFGASDYAEIRTGGEWWTPWWLLLWNARPQMFWQTRSSPFTASDG